MTAMQNAQYLPHPVFSTPIFTVEQLIQHIKKLNKPQDASTLTDLIRDSYDCHAEKPMRGAIKNLVTDYLQETAFNAAYAVSSKEENLQVCIKLAKYKFTQIEEEMMSSCPNNQRIKQALQFIENELNTCKDILSKAA